MIAAAARALTTKLSEMTPRERAGLAALAAIAALTAAVYAVDWASVSSERAESAAQAATDGAALQATFADERYRQQLASGAGHVWRWSRTADAFAGEEIVSEIEALCLQAGFSEPRVTLVEQAPRAGRVGNLEVSVSTAFDWASFLAVLEAFETSDLSIAVRSIDVSEDEGAQRLTMVISVPVIDAGEPS